LDILENSDLPRYDQDDDENLVAAVQRLKSQINAAQGVMFITPEYNRSIPGVLKNVIDHPSRPYGQSVWAGKPSGVIGSLDRRHGHCPRPAETAQHFGLFGYADIGSARGIHPS
jgi:NAD(P)H-dependent FMN reductase